MNKCTRYTTLLLIPSLLTQTTLQGSFASKVLIGGISLGSGFSMATFALPWLMLGALIKPPVLSDPKCKKIEAPSEEFKEPENEKFQLPLVSISCNKVPESAQRKALPSQTITPINEHIPLALATLVKELPKKIEQPVFINLNLTQQHVVTTAENSNDNTPISTMQAVTSAPKALPSLLPKNRSSILACLWHKAGSAFTWIGSHKVFCISYGMASVYSSMWLYLRYAHLSLTNPQCWSLWKQLCTLPQLYQTNKDELIASLHQSFKDTYGSDNEVANSERFMKEAKDELNHLKRYEQAVSSLERWGVSRFFYVTTLSLVTIMERMCRLEFLHKIINGWLIETKKGCSYENLFYPR